MILFLKLTRVLSIRAICFAVFAWQFYLLTRNYLQFNVRKEVTYYIPDEIELPEIRIRIPYQFALDPEILRTKYKTYFDKTCRLFSAKGDCDGHLTNPILFTKSLGPYLLLSDIATHSYSPEMFISQLHLTGFKDDPRITGECKLTSQASSSYFIIILRCLDSFGLPLKVSRSETVIYNGNYLMGFKLNATAILLNVIYPGKSLVEDDSHYAYSSLTSGKQISHGIRFTKHTENLLPLPYKTMCRNYDRRQTFEDCLNALSIEKTGMLFPGTTVPLDTNSESKETRFNAMFHKDNGELQKIYEECKSHVSQPICNSIQYKFKMSHSSEDVPIGKEAQSLLFTISSEPDSLTESRAEFPLSDYLILCGSLISSWFGISIMSQLIAASNFFCITVERKRIIDVEKQNEELAS